MVEESPDYVFPSSFHVVKPHGLGEAGVMVTRLFGRKNEASSKIFGHFLKGILVVVFNLNHSMLLIII